MFVQVTAKNVRSVFLRHSVVMYAVVWLSGSALVAIRSYFMPSPVSTGMGDGVQGSTPGAGYLSQYITSYPG